MHGVRLLLKSRGSAIESDWCLKEVIIKCGRVDEQVKPDLEARGIQTIIL